MAIFSAHLLTLVGVSRLQPTLLPTTSDGALAFVGGSSGASLGVVVGGAALAVLLVLFLVVLRRRRKTVERRVNAHRRSLQLPGTAMLLLSGVYNVTAAHATADFEGAAPSPKDDDAVEGGAGEGEGDLAPSGSMLGLPVMSAVDLTRFGGEPGGTAVGHTRAFSTTDQFPASSSVPDGQMGADGFTGDVYETSGGTEVRGDNENMQNPTDCINAFSAFGLDYDHGTGAGDAGLFNETGANMGGTGGTGGHDGEDLDYF